MRFFTVTTAGALAASALLVLPAQVADAAAPSCSAIVTGVDHQGRVHSLTVANGSVTKHATSAPLGFTVKNQGVWAADSTADSYTLYTRATTTDGVPRSLEITSTTADPTTLTVKSTRFAQNRWRPKLFTASYGFYDYAFAGDKLARVTTYRKNENPGSKLYFGDLRIIGRHLHLKTLAYVGRFKSGHGKQDVLYATTRAGGLMIIKVTTKKKPHATIRVIKRSGFKSYTGLSLATCGKTKLGIVAVDAKHGKARWYSVAHFLAPKAKHVKKLMRIAPNESWKLRALV